MTPRAVWLAVCGALWAGVVAGESARDGFYIDVPYVHQAPAYCGPAVLAMVFRYWGVAVDQHGLAVRYEPVSKQGLSGKQLKEIAKAEGFAAFSFSSDSGKALIEHLRRGRPVIVALSARGRSNHYVLLVGWDSEHDEWLAHDPAKSAYVRIPAKELSRRHARLDHWTLLVLPEQGKGSTP